MKCESPTQAVLVSLPISFVEAILTLQSALDDDVTSALGKSLAGARTVSTALLDPPATSFDVHERGKYAAEFLGVRVSADTLAAIFGQVVDMMAAVAPEALVSLAAIRTPRRRFISLEARGIHLASPHLPVQQTASGWWISKNISQDQLKSALRAICEASGLTFGKDLMFPVR
jgi:hypothetical protein